jgi:hypothetical protein
LRGRILVNNNGTIYKYASGVFTKIADMGSVGYGPTALSLGSDDTTFYGFASDTALPRAELFSVTTAGVTRSGVRINATPANWQPTLAPDGSFVGVETQTPKFPDGSVIGITGY